MKFANTLIFLPGTKIMLDPSLFFGERVGIINEFFDEMEEGADYVWSLSNNYKMSFDPRRDKLTVYSEWTEDGADVDIYDVPKQLHDDWPMYWGKDFCVWKEPHDDSLYMAPIDASEEFTPQEIKNTVMHDLYALFVEIEAAISNDAVWIVRDFDTENNNGVLQTKLSNSKDVSVAIDCYLSTAQNECVLSDNFVKSAQSFVSRSSAKKNQMFPEDKMVLQALGGLSVTRIN